ncbi:MAG: hypothetical protein A3C35_04585 [Omnitrophica bacterium RIFCSPHIGHO2_02_FULL_46_11]|nr:MAG: hypothetical protein A3C35_04585 [Omnitrophica bacterium RIFCSPHIGHO2_02_FULL_46_11]OGW85916.1 MAG: hypothetical protein A3A81_00045 [Omnitrophica bacterium RIFCSPLOWO2_01_FULL_45_10b]
MDTPQQILGKIQKLIDSNPQYKVEAYSFLLAALHFTMASLKEPRHITGQEFCEGIRQYAIDQFGPLAGTVLHYWGIRETLDFGRLVFALVEVGLMRKTEEDSLSDFKDVYDFKTAFEAKFTFDS